MTEQTVQKLPPGAAARAWVAALLAWMIPGGGHFYLDRKGRAALYFVIVTSLFVGGLMLDGKIYSLERGSPLALLALFAEFGVGAPFIIIKMLASNAGDIQSATFEHGTTYLLTAGLMNLLLSLDAHDIGLGRKP